MDKDGNVTFSDCKPGESDSVRMEVEEGPTEAEILEAKEQAKKEMNEFNRITGQSDSPSDLPDQPATTDTKKSQERHSGTKTSMSRKKREAQQIVLDEKCQVAREKIQNVERAQYVEECVQGRSRRTREECERCYADHGADTATRGPLYLDLPECVEAYELRRNLNR